MPRAHLVLAVALGAIVGIASVLARRRKQRTSVPRVFVGTVIHSSSFDKLHILENHAIGVKGDGTIAFLRPAGSAQELAATLKEFGFSPKDVHYLHRGAMIMPGMVDTHAHAPQYAFAGNGMDMPLLDWLQTYTFPTESRFSDIEYARKVYDRSVRSHLRCGTTTCTYFGTIHQPATRLLAETVQRYGQRALIGKVCMDRNSPDTYIETTEASLRGTEEFVEHVRAMGDPLVQPIITPRFVPTCSHELLGGLGKLAAKFDTHIQSHVSENVKEVEWVAALHPEHGSYSHVYDHYGLLNRKTVMAHGVHLTDKELDLFALRGAGISHCPYSNCGLLSGILDVFKVVKKGVKLGLGTDVAGGCHPSIFENIRMAVHMSKARSFARPHGELQTLSIDNAFYLGTLGGAGVLDMDKFIGNFEPGKQFDALLVDVTGKDSPVHIFDKDTTRNIFEKFCYLGDDRNIRQIFVNGKDVTPSSP